MLSNANFELGFFSNYAIILTLTQMNSKPIDLTEVSSSTSWFSTVLTKRRLKVWLWLALSLLLLAAGMVIEFKTSIVQAWIFTRTKCRAARSSA